MVPASISFPGLEVIPNLEAVLDENGEAVFLKVKGNCPLVICAPHTATNDSTPGGAKVFGQRPDNSTETTTATISDDTNTLPITFGIVRTLSALGCIPHTVINLVSRRYMDLNRTWKGQVKWVEAEREYYPEDENKSPDDFPEVEEFRAFKNTYYQQFHDTLNEMTTSLHPDGWLFDIHGRTLAEADLVVFSGYGYYARQDFVYGSSFSLHRCLRDQGFALLPTDPNPADEVRDADGNPITNLNSGGRYGARFFDPSRDPVPFRGNVSPNQPHRVHGIQFEISGSLRHGKSAEFLESLGINLGYAIFNCFLNNGLLNRNPAPQPGEAAPEWYGLLG